MCSYLTVSCLAELTLALIRSMNRRGWNEFLQRMTLLDEASQKQAMEHLCSAYKDQNKRRG